MNRLALGTAQFGFKYGVANRQGQVKIEEARAILECARASGIDTIDTAMSYGDSEERLGSLGIVGCNVVSKLPAIPDGCHHILDWIINSLHNSLEQLKVQNFYALLLHRPQQLQGKNGAQIYKALEELKRSGVVQKIGISIYEPTELDAFCNRYKFDIIQAPFNILDRRLINSGWLMRLQREGIELHVRSVFLQGLLLMERIDRPSKFDPWSSLWTFFENWLMSNKITPLEACMRYALSFPQISKVIVGVDSLQQLGEILQASKGPLPSIPKEFESSDIRLLNPARWIA